MLGGVPEAEEDAEPLPADEPLWPPEVICPADDWLGEPLWAPEEPCPRAVPLPPPVASLRATASGEPGAPFWPAWAPFCASCEEPFEPYGLAAVP